MTVQFPLSSEKVLAQKDIEFARGLTDGHLLRNMVIAGLIAGCAAGSAYGLELGRNTYALLDEFNGLNNFLQQLSPELASFYESASSAALQDGRQAALAVGLIGGTLVGAKALFDATNSVISRVSGMFKSKAMVQSLEQMQMAAEALASPVAKGTRSCLRADEILSNKWTKRSDWEAAIKRDTDLRHSHEQINVADFDNEKGRLTVMSMKDGRVHVDNGPAIRVYERNDEGQFDLVKEGLHYLDGKRTDEVTYQAHLDAQAAKEAEYKDKEALWNRAP